MYRPPAVFTQGNRCDKIHLHLAFFDGTRYVDTPLVHAQAIIGTRAPQNMKDRGYMVQRLIKGVDTYCLTPEGREWLKKGVARHLALHPADISRINKGAPRNTPGPRGARHAGRRRARGPGKGVGGRAPGTWL